MWYIFGTKRWSLFIILSPISKRLIGALKAPTASLSMYFGEIKDELFIWERGPKSYFLNNFADLAGRRRLKRKLLSTRWRVFACVRVCVFFPIILDVKFVGCTSRGHTGGRPHKIYHPPSFCGAFLYFSREKDLAVPFPRRPWSRFFVY